MTTKKHQTKSKSKSKSKTKKCKLSKQELQLVCTNTTHVLDSFEADFEKLLQSILPKMIFIHISITNGLLIKPRNLSKKVNIMYKLIVLESFKKRSIMS